VPTDGDGSYMGAAFGAGYRHRSGWLDWRKWPAWLTAAVTLINGVAVIVRVLTTEPRAYPTFFSSALPFGIHHWGRSLTAVLGFLLIYLSFNLFRRKRMAWALALTVAVLAVLAHVGSGQPQRGIIAPGVTAVLLLAFHGSFTVRSEPRSMRWGALMVMVSLSVALAYGTAGFWLLDRADFGVEFHLSDALVRTLREFSFIGNADLVPRTRMAHWFLDSLLALGSTAAVSAAYSLFRPLAYRLRTLPHERERARAILKEHGRSPNDFFKLWPDKSYFFSQSGASCIAYKVAWGVAMGLGDPAGPADDIEAATRDFMTFCGDCGWDVAFHQVLPDFIRIYADLGLQFTKVGEEAVVDLARFSNETSQKRDFRRIKRKFSGEGYTSDRHLPPQGQDLMDAIEEVSREWLSLPGRRERSFTLGKFDRDYLKETPIFCVKDPAGRIMAFANEIPSYRSGEATVDLMRHRVEIPNGTMDFLFLELLRALHSEGFIAFDLGLAPLGGVGGEPGSTLQERAIHELFSHLNRFFAFRGLRSYKAKFEPEWQDRFLVYQGGPVGLVKTGLALVRAAEG
jgi:phosphatidylglycerol lysyltransferase